MVIVPVSVCAAVGVKVMLMLQLEPMGTLAQLSVCEKSPDAVILDTVKPLVPVLESCTVSGGVLEVLMTWLPKDSDEGVSVIPGVVPVPVICSTNSPLPLPTVYSI